MNREYSYTFALEKQMDLLIEDFLSMFNFEENGDSSLRK